MSIRSVRFLGALSPGIVAVAVAIVLGGVGVPAAGAAAAPDLQGWIDEQVDAGAALAVVVTERSEHGTRHHAGGMRSPAGGAPAADPDTQFQIGSITKAYTHLLLAEMVAAGKVDYDTTIAEIIAADFAFANPAVGAITLRALATHTSGLPRLPPNLVPADAADPYSDYDEAALLAGLATTRAGQPLGSHFAYSNFGAGLLGYLLGEVHGAGYQAALQEYLLSPAALAATAFRPGENAAAGFHAGEVVPAWRFDALAGAGALWSTTPDLLRLLRPYLEDDRSGFRRDPGADLLPVEASAGPYGVTRVWHVTAGADERVYWHSGRTGGYAAFLGFRPATGQAVAILVSGDADPTAAGLDWLGGAMRPVAPAAPDAAVTGQYRIAAGLEIGVFVSDGRLLAQVTGQSPVPLTPVGDDWYAVDVVDASVRFVRAGDDDRVVALELVQNGAVQRGEKVAGQAVAASRRQQALPRAALAEYAGEYVVGESARFTVRLADNGLEVRLTGQPFLPVYPAGDDRFFYKVVDAELQFERDAGGRIDALVLLQGPIRQRAERVP